MIDKKVALVTGANRGLGIEIARQLGRNGVLVVLGIRDAIYGVQIEEQLKGEGLDVVFHQLDVTNINSIQSGIELIKIKFGRLDILINNAGVLLDRDQSSFHIPVDIIKTTLETNTYGPLMLCQSAIPLMQENGYGRIVNVSSDMGLLSHMDGGYLAYRISKAALNTMTITLAREMSSGNILVNAMDPGWIKTDMGGGSAFRSVEEGADTVVYLATLPDASPSGLFYKDRTVIPW